MVENKVVSALSEDTVIDEVVKVEPSKVEKSMEFTLREEILVVDAVKSRPFMVENRV